MTPLSYHSSNLSLIALETMRLLVQKKIVNRDEFQITVPDKFKSNNSETKFAIGSEKIQTVLSVYIQARTKDDKLNLNLHFGKICLKSGNQFNAFVRLKFFFGNEKRKVLVNSFDLSNFNYCLLVRMLANTNYLHKIEGIRKRA